jgi:hypothetical protein
MEEHNECETMNGSVCALASGLPLLRVSPSRRDRLAHQQRVRTHSNELIEILIEIGTGPVPADKGPYCGQHTADLLVLGFPTVNIQALNTRPGSKACVACQVYAFRCCILILNPIG